MTIGDNEISKKIKCALTNRIGYAQRHVLMRLTWPSFRSRNLGKMTVLGGPEIRVRGLPGMLNSDVFFLIEKVLNLNKYASRESSDGLREDSHQSHFFARESSEV